MADIAYAELDIPSADNPYRPPDWRWQIAKDYAERPLDANVRRSTDAWVIRAARLQDDLAKAARVSSRAAVLRTYGPIGRAFQIYHSAAIAPMEASGGQVGRPSTPSPCLFATELDGYLLAGMTDEEIETMCGTPAAVVAAYANLFFDIRDRLDDGAWISSNIVGSLHRASPDQMTRSLILMYGYSFKSPELVRMLSRGVDPSVGSGGSLYDAVVADSRLALAIKASLAARTISPSSAVFEAILGIQQRRIEFEQEMGSGAEPEQKYKKVLSEFLETQVAYRTGLAPRDNMPMLIVHPDPTAPEKLS